MADQLSSVPLDQLSSFVTSMIALSIGVERIVEIIKGILPWLADSPNPRRPLLLQLLAAAAGALIAGFLGPHCFVSFFGNMDADMGPRVLESAFLGLMASGGSAFWNHALDIVGAIKTVKEKDAKQSPA